LGFSSIISGSGISGIACSRKWYINQNLVHQLKD
jgi:hypothetical protein